MKLVFMAVLLFANDRPCFSADHMIQGFNIVNPHTLSGTRREEIISQLKNFGIVTIRVPWAGKDTLSFIKSCNQIGIGVVLVFYASDNVQSKIVRSPKGYPNVYSGVPLSQVDRQLFKAKLSSVIEMLDQNRISLRALEVGNEINWAPFNRDFVVPSQGVVMDTDDLVRSKEGIIVSRGYKNYISLISASKEALMASKFSKDAMLLGGGFSETGAGGRPNGLRLDAVSVQATFSFLRKAGAEKYLDAFSLHLYPGDNPSSDFLMSDSLEACANSAIPCWITEWGIKQNGDCAQSSDSTAEIAAVKRFFSKIRSFIRSKKIVAMTYFSWNDENTKKQNSYSVFKCGQISELGDYILRMK